MYNIIFRTTLVESVQIALTTLVESVQRFDLTTLVESVHIARRRWWNLYVFAETMLVESVQHVILVESPQRFFPETTWVESVQGFVQTTLVKSVQIAQTPLVEFVHFLFLSMTALMESAHPEFITRTILPCSSGDFLSLASHVGLDTQLTGLKPKIGEKGQCLDQDLNIRNLSVYTSMPWPLCPGTSLQPLLSVWPVL